MMSSHAQGGKIILKVCAYHVIVHVGAPKDQPLQFMVAPNSPGLLQVKPFP